MVPEKSPRDLEACDQLSAALPDAEISEPDDVGLFNVAGRLRRP
jgi:hypothetical protein